MANKTVGDLFATLQATTTAVTALMNALTPLVDGLEGFTDGLEGAVGVTSDTAIDAGAAGTVLANLRRLTTDLGSIKTTLATISGNVDGLEGFTDGIEGLITSLNSYVDGLEGKDFATQTTLAAVLAKLSADPATQTTLAAIAAKDFATQTTLAALKAVADDLKTAITAIKDTSGIKRIIDAITISEGKGLSAVAVVASDVADITPTAGIYLGVGGDLKVTLSGMTDGTYVVFKNMPAGVIHPLKVKRVWLATTATNILAVY